MKKVIISQRAYLSMLAEVYERVETETGGILLGHRDGDTWYVLESIEPGPKSIFTPTYFEYDDVYVTYRANKVSRLYKCSVNLLGLWHRHPSLMKTFSSTDDGTNKTYSDMLGGAISGIVTLGNGFEITMYYVPSDVRYERIEWVIDDNQIPKEYLAYYDTEYYKNLINEESRSSHSFIKPFIRRAEDTPGSNQRVERGALTDNSEPRQPYISDYQRPKKGFLSVLLERVRGAIYDMFEGLDDKQEYGDVEYTTLNEDESDIAIIFDTIEPEIAHLQQLEAEGKIKCSYESKKDCNGKDGLVLTIVDMRQPEKYNYKMIFFMSNGLIRVKDEDGEVRTYNNNLISMILGG